MSLRTRRKRWLQDGNGCFPTDHSGAVTATARNEMRMLRVIRQDLKLSRERSQQISFARDCRMARNDDRCDRSAVRNKRQRRRYHHPADETTDETRIWQVPGLAKDLAKPIE